MKYVLRQLFFVVSLVSFISLTPLFVFADIGPPAGFHSINLCVTVKNQNPDMVLIANYTGPTTDPSKGYLIENDTCIVGAYKFASLSIFETSKEKFTSIDLNKFNSTDVTLLASNVPFYGGFIADATHLKGKNVEYSIESSGVGVNSTVTLYKSKEVSVYNDGTPDKIETFPASNSTVNNTKDFLDLGTVTLKYGSSGEYVKNLQINLNTYLGVTISPDGKFGAKTESYVKVFQTKNNLPVDGVVGNKTKKLFTTVSHS